MVQVLNSSSSLLFSVTIWHWIATKSQLMNFSTYLSSVFPSFIKFDFSLCTLAQKLAKSVQVTSDFSRLHTKTQEPRGVLRFEIQGSIAFEQVSFTYPKRPLAPGLKEVNLQVKSGKCVAIVGSSGSGKLTVVSLLQCFYEPTSGLVTIGETGTRCIRRSYLFPWTCPSTATTNFLSQS